MDSKTLIKDVIDAQITEQKYQNENDAKFRAVQQRVESYNEFRAIVQGCHLRPLEKKESILAMSKSVPAWNAAASQDKNITNFDLEVNKYFPPINGPVEKQKNTIAQKNHDN